MRTHQGLLAALLGVAACSDTTTTTIDRDHDLAAVIGASLVTPARGGELGSLGDAAMIARGGLPVGFTEADNGIVTGTHFGLTYSYLVFCRDAAGMRLDTCGPAADHATAIAEVHGNLWMPGFDTVASRQALWTLSYLRSPMATATGGSSSTDAVSFLRADNTTAEYQITADKDVTLGLDMSGYDAVSGAAEISLTATSGDWSTDLTAKATLNMDRTADLVLDTGAVYRIDLTTGDLMPLIR